LDLKLLFQVITNEGGREGRREREGGRGGGREGGIILTCAARPALPYQHVRARGRAGHLDLPRLRFFSCPAFGVVLGLVEEKTLRVIARDVSKEGGREG